MFLLIVAFVSSAVGESAQSNSKLDCHACYEVAKTIHNHGKITKSALEALVPIELKPIVAIFYHKFEPYIQDATKDPMQFCTKIKLCKKKRIENKNTHIDLHTEVCKQVPAKFVKLLHKGPVEIEILPKLQKFCSKLDDPQECTDFINMNYEKWMSIVRSGKGFTPEQLCEISQEIKKNGAPSFASQTGPDWSVSWEEAL